MLLNVFTGDFPEPLEEFTEALHEFIAFGDSPDEWSGVHIEMAALLPGKRRLVLSIRSRITYHVSKQFRERGKDRAKNLDGS